MKCFLTAEAVLKWLETPSVYHIKSDALYELDNESFEFLRGCVSEDRNDTEENEFITYCMKEGILTDKKPSVKRPPLIKSPEPSLRYLELQITNKCNLKCRHCYIGDTDFKELSIGCIKNILAELEEMQGLRVLLTGGEPLLHSRFMEINEMLPEFSLRKVLFTSGVLLKREIIETLNVDEVQISIDGLEDAHDSLRGRGTYKAAIGAIEDCLALNYEVSVSTMVHSKNLQDFDKMEKLFKSMGINEWSVDIPSVTGRMIRHPEFQAAPVDAARCLNYGFGGGIHGSEPGFACGLHLMTVMADGRAAKCTFYSDRPVGSAEEGLRSCWQRIRPIRLSDLKCDCEDIASCRGGCRYRAETLGDSSGRDLYKCASYAIMKS